MEFFRKWPKGEPKELICNQSNDALSGSDALRRNIYLFVRDFVKKRDFGGPWLAPDMRFGEGEPVDMPHVGFGHVAVSLKIAEAIGPFIAEQAELLPIEISNCTEQYFWVFAKPIPNALNMEKSVIKFSSDDPNRIRNVEKYVFNEDVLDSIDIFGPHATDSRPMFSKTLVQAMMEANPMGVEFRPV